MKKLLLPIIYVLLLISCGGGGSSDNGNNNHSLNTGTFTDIEINNLQYLTDGEVFKTTDDNKFYYSDNNTVKFYIDGILIGETIPKKEISFFDDVIGSEYQIFSDKNINALTLLKTFDSDNNIANGIEIQENTQDGNDNPEPPHGRSFNLIPTNNNNQNIKNTIKIDGYHPIFISNLSNEYKNKQIYNTNFNFKPQCKLSNIYVFDERVTTYLCSHYDRIPWIQKYQNYLLFMQTQLVKSEQESWDQSQAKISQIMKILDAYQDTIKAGLTKEKMTSLFKLAESVAKLMSINKDMGDLTVNEVDNVFAATENILIALSGGLDAEKIIKILENYSNFNDMEAAETFLKSVNGYLNDFDGLKSLAIASAVSIAKTEALEFIKNTKLNEKTGGIFANTANMMFDAVNVYKGCLKKPQSSNVIQCLGNSGYDLFEGLMFNLAHIVNSSTHYYAWNENRELSNHFLKQALALEYFLKRNFDETVIRLDISSNSNNLINWMSPKISFLFGIHNKDNTQFWVSLENELEKLNNGDNLTLDEKDKSAIMGLFNPDAVIKAAKGVLQLTQNEEESKITIHYVDILANHIPYMDNHQIICDLNGVTILNDNFKPTYNNAGYSKEVSYNSAPSTQILSCNISTSGFYNDTKSLQFYYNNNIEKPSQPVTNSPGSANAPGPTLTNLKPTLSWSAVDGATDYQVAVRNVDTNELVVNKSDVANTHWEITSNLPIGKYFWDVSACNDVECGTWSDSLYFQIEESTDKPSIPNITGEYITYEAVVIYWDAVDGATKYQLELEDVDNGGIQTTEVTTESDGFTNLTSEHDYKIRVRAYNSNGYGDFSPYINFKTNKYVPDAPSLIVIEVEGLNAIMAWQKVDGADKYNVEVIDIDGNDDLSEEAEKNAITISNLTEGHRYKVRIKARVDGSWGDYSDYKYFEIVDESPTISSISPSPIIKSSNKQNIYISGLNFTNSSRVHWKTSNGSSGIVSSANTDYPRSGKVRVNIRVIGSSHTWYFKVVDDGKESGWKSVAMACALRHFPDNEITEYLQRGFSDEQNGVSQVASLQEFLNELEYRSGVINGVFGPTTESAVKAYQNANGLTSDGKVGSQTRAKINNTCN